MMNKISHIYIGDEPIGSGYSVIVETRQGNRYITWYTTAPTKDEVKEDFQENRSSFVQIN